MLLSFIEIQPDPNAGAPSLKGERQKRRSYLLLVMALRLVSSHSPAPALIASAPLPPRRAISVTDPNAVFDTVADDLVVSILLMVIGAMLCSINGLSGLEFVSLDDVVIV